MNLNTKLVTVFNSGKFKPYDLNERTYNLIRRLIYSDNYFNDETTFQELLDQVENKKLMKNKRVGVTAITNIKEWISKYYH